jgi:PAS domain S-box-containing protein
MKKEAQYTEVAASASIQWTPAPIDPAQEISQPRSMGVAIAMRPSQPDEPPKQDSPSTPTSRQLQNGEFLLKKTLDVLPGFVWSASPDGRLEFCNHRWLEYAGTCLEQVKGTELAAAMCPEDRAAFEERWRAALTQVEPLDAEARMRRADGCYRWFRIRATPLRDAPGGITCWYGINIDIEDLKRAQQEVLKQTSRLDELFEQTPEAVAFLNTDDRITRINKEFTRLFGYEPDEVVDRPINDLIVPERLAEGAREWTNQLKRGQRLEVETVRRRKDGAEAQVSLLAVPIIAASGEQVGNYAIYRDITERKRAEERLLESEVRFQAIADTAPVMIWTTGTDSLCNYFSQPWLDFTGRTMPQEVGTGWTEGVYPEDLQGCLDCFLPAFHARKPFRMEYRLRRADGEYRWVDESGIPRYTPGGEFAGYIGCNIDITDRKRAESLLAGEKRILEMVAKGDSLSEILDGLCRLVEEQASDALASILLLDGDRLRHGAAPSLPKAYADAIDCAMIGPFAGSCGTAAYRGEPVIVEEIASDPSWANYRNLALAHHLLACWSTRVFSSQGQVIATFAMYYREPRRPSARDLEMIERITHLAGVAIERKLTQDKLRRSEAYLTEAQRLAHTGSWAWNPIAGKGIYWSEEMFRICGFDPQEGVPTSETFLQRVHPEDRDKVREVPQKAAAQKVEYVLDYRIVLPDGTVRNLETIDHPVLDAKGEIVEYVGTAVDVTERKHAEEALRRSEAYLAEAQRLTHTCSWVWRVLDKNPVHLSEEWYRIYGCDPAQGMPGWEKQLARIHPEDRTGWENAIEQAILAKADYDVEFRIVLADGRVKWIHSEGHPILTDAGDLVQFLGSSTEITERKRADEERERLRQLEADLAHINRVSMMGEFAASVAHEIKQPIAAAATNARTCLRWLLREPPEIGEARATASRIVTDVSRATDIINRVRSLYTKGSQQRDWVDVNELIEEMVVLLRNEANRYSIPIHSYLAEDLPKVMADRVQLQQVFMNIMLNGIEAMKGLGGELTLKSLQNPDGQLLISVNDTGVGFPPEEADRVFDAFFTTKPQGTGMGLSISRSIVESHGGRLWAEGHSGQGATFYFTLPTEAKAMEASHAGA